MDFKGKVVLVTGAGSGIGMGISLHFAKLSASLSLIDINFEKLDKVVEVCESSSKEKVFKVVTDISERENVKYVVNATKEEFGKIDVVINCAGVSGNSDITSGDLLDVFDKVINVNLKSVIAVTHFAAEALIESKGCVVNIASMLASFAGKGAIPYIVSKAGVAHFTKCAALELAGEGVRLNSISPGPVKTNLLLNVLKSQEENDKFWDHLGAVTPLGHLVKAEEIAELAAFLSSDKAKSITGSDFVIDCGVTLEKI